MPEPTKMEVLMSFAKRRGFVFPTAEIYGGLQGFWDWGPLGVEFKNNIKREWWKRFVQGRPDVVGQDASIVTNPTVWQKSGHVQGFADKLVECKACHHRFKGDDLTDHTKCPDCGGQLTGERDFNTMFTTHVGPVEDTAATVFMRPETAQNIFVNFDTVRQTMRLKLPFGIGQIGKAFRNEITPGNFIFRSREFEQMELEFFCHPGEDERWYKFWCEESLQWFLDLGIKADHLRFHEQSKAELAHYSKATTDIEYNFPFEKGWSELMGIANRTDFDLKAHGQSYRDDKTPEAIVPYCIEPSAGVDRAALAFLLDAYEEVEGGRSTTTEATKEKEVVLRLHKSLAPIKVAILPLSKKEPLAGKAQEIAAELRKHWTVMYDGSQSIGRRYRRQDEIGTPYCVTVDFDTIEKDQKVTVRDRDTMAQERVGIGELPSYVQEKFST